MAEDAFKSGHKVPTNKQDEFPGKEHKMKEEAHFDTVPTEDQGFQTYKAAGKLQGKKAIITGGDSGIGRATAILFAMEGADSMIAYLPDEEKDARETKQRVEKYGVNCHLHATDLTDRANCKKVVDDAVARMGGIDILFNNAAFQQMVETIAELSEDQWVKTFNTNIHPYFYMTKYALEVMKPGATIINNASINAYVGRPDLLDYTSTKGAIVSFTRGVSNQVVGKGIRANCVAPGPVWTPLIPSTMSKEALEKFKAPIGRPGQPSEVATCVVFLASTDSSLLSGQTIHCNGGTVVNG